MLEQRRIEMGHARALLGLTTRRQQIEVAQLVAKKGLSVRDTEALVRHHTVPGRSRKAEPGAVDPDIHRLESASWPINWAPKWPFNTRPPARASWS
jgi:ParB family chromosome partitioning protein